jgi:uncharacterized protein YbaA (DUF1428 family)
MSYVDVVVIPIPEANLEAYKKLVKLAGKAWMKHGALRYMEALADDVQEGKVTDLYRAVKRKEGETIGFAFVMFKNRKHRDEVMKKVMSDPSLAEAMKNMPFDGKRMIFGGFKPIIELEAKEPAAAK